MLATAKPAAEPEAVEGQQPLQYAAIGAEHDPQAQQADAAAAVCRLQGQLFPVLANLVRKIGTGNRRILIQRRGVRGTIKADGRGIEPDLRRARAGGEFLQQRLGQPPAAIRNPLFLLHTPAPVSNGFTGQVDDGVVTVQIWQIIQAQRRDLFTK